MPHTDRHKLFVDVETSGLSPDADWAVEVAWLNMTTGESGEFVPAHPVETILRFGDPKALEVNRYRDRLVHAEQDVRNVETLRLHHQLTENTIVGANPAFDTRFLAELFNRAGVIKLDPWAYRLWDIEAYAAAVLDLDYVPGQTEICQRLGIPPGDHTAARDVRAGVDCYHELRRLRASLMRRAT